jgi:hypothetical protein
MITFAAKRLAAVEVDRSRSNQRELNAGRLRKLLGLPEAKTEGRMFCLLINGDVAAERFEEGTYTLYDSREAVEGRRPEWRLYVHGADMWLNALEGDLLVIARPSPDSTDLWAVVCAAAGGAAALFEEALLAGSGSAVLKQFQQVHPRFGGAAESRQLALQLVGQAGHASRWSAEDHPIFQSAIASGKKPSGRELARAAITIAEDSFDQYPGPDVLIHAAMGVETELYFAIERELGEREYSAIVNRGGTFEEVLALAMSAHQARKSRRGNSLQNHLAYILDRHRIPYGAQCTTEHGERPDFIIPGCAQYHDLQFPASRLRMVSCKSLLRDRWRQVLHEAARIPVKYQLTVDSGLTRAVVGNMAAAGILVFVPLVIKQAATEDLQGELGTVADLVREVAAVTTQYQPG